jgi:hypothetical protein
MQPASWGSRAADTASGVAGGMPFDALLHLSLVGQLPEKATYSVCGVGPNQIKAAFQSAISGGHIRIGIEGQRQAAERRARERQLGAGDLGAAAGRHCGEARGHSGRGPQNPQFETADLGLGAESKGGDRPDRCAAFISEEHHPSINPYDSEKGVPCKKQSDGSASPWFYPWCWG